MNKSTLHIIDQPLAAEALTAQLSLFTAHDGLIFIQDGCYSLKSPAILSRLQQSTLTCYALIDDLQARNISAESITSINYPAFVDLSLEYNKTISW